DSIIDQLKGHQTEMDIEALKDADSIAAKTNTGARDPGMLSLFNRLGPNPEIEINIDAVRKLYGDKVPTPDDGLLGWVPGIYDQLQASALTNAPIRVSLADWLAHGDPDVKKGLYEDVAVRRGSPTLKEAKELKPIDLDQEIFDQPDPHIAMVDG